MATATTIKYSLLCANFLLSFVEANPSPFAFPEPATLNSTTNGPPINSVFLPSQSGIGPSFCPNGFNLTSSLSPDYGIVASSSYPVKEHCDGKTWMPLGATSNGVPTVHAIYYSPYSSPSAVQTSTINLITAFVNGASTSSWFAPLTKYYDDCNHKPAVYFMGFVMGEFVSYYCDKNGSGNSNRCTAIAQADETWVISNQISNGVIGLQNLDVYVFVVDPAIDEYSAGISGGQKLGVTYCSYHAGYQDSASGKWLDYTVVQPSSSVSCSFNSTTPTANGVALDSMIFNLAHELVEAVLAPNAADRSITAFWQDSLSNEPMDKCGCFAAGAKSNTKGLLYNTFFNNNYFILPSIFDPVSNQCVFNADTPSPAVDGEGYCLQCSSSGTKAMFSGNSSGTLKAGSKISLTNGMYLTQQTDGSLYLKSTTSTTVYFASNTGGQSFNIGFKSLMQTDGNFVVYNPSGSPIFNTVTGGQSTSYKYCMAIMPSGDMALYSSARCSSPIWQASKGVSLNKPCNGALSCSYSYLGNFVAY